MLKLNTMKKGIVEYNTAIQTIGKIISAGMGFVTIGILTRYLGESGFGIYTLVFVYLSFFGIFGELGLQLTMVRELNKQNKNEAILGTYFWLKVILSALSVIIALIFLLFFPYNWTVKSAIIIASFGFALGNFNTFGSTIFQSKVRLELVTFSDLISRIVTTLLIVVFVFLHFNLNIILSALIIGNCASLFFNFYQFKYLSSIRYIFDRLLAKNLIIKSLPVALITLLSLLYFKIDTMILSLYRPSEELGYYGLVNKIFDNLLVLWGFYMASVYPMLSDFVYKLQNEKALVLWNKSKKTALFSSVIIAIVGIIFAPLVISLFGGNRFEGSILSLRIVLIGLPFFYLNNLFFHLCLTKEKSKIPIYAILISLLFNLVLDLLFIPKYGYISASIITVSTEILLFVSYFSFTNYLKVKI
jgi:O-antigen/teichoic acid export membrane protein